MKEKGRKIILVLCLLLCFAGVAYLVVDYVKKDENNDIYEEVQKKKKVVKEKESDDKVEEEEPVEIPIDFADLKETNADIYAWITIPDTNVDYPIVQSATDDSYYLNHTIEGKKGYPGSIYTEKVNAKDFSDFNTVIYGHDMADGTMFKHLHKFKNAEFFNTHDTITVYTETEIKTYRIFAAVVYDNRHLMYFYDNDDPESCKAFIQSLYASKNMSNLFREGMEIDENSKLITLSTCITGQPNKRLLIVAEEIQK